jgi:hypothetical protein
MKSRPEHILSFRTAGQFPGFVHFKNADLPDYMCIDAGGYSGWSTISGRPLKSLDMPTLANSRKICDKLFKDQVPVDDAKLPQPDQDAAAMPLPARYVFVALQGKVVDGPDPERFGTKAMLQIVMDRFQGTDISVVVKLPPRLTNANLIGWLIAETQLGSIILSENSMHSLAAGSEAVITVNSKVGSEVMIHRKPIYCFGGSDYDAIAHRITSADQFKDLTTPIRPAVRENDLLRFIAYYRTKYLVNRAEPGRLESVLQERLIDPILKARTV